MKRLHIFKAGTHKGMNGVSVDLTEADVAASAAAYDPAIHEAPLVVGHPKLNEPAYGWVKSLSATGNDLLATPHQVNTDFAEMVEGGSFKKISASFYLPDATSNPKPGAYYLRHVGFLGAQPPAIKGLKAIEFSEAEAGVVTVELSEADFAEPRILAGIIARMARAFREYLIDQSGQDVADRVMPAWVVDDAIIEQQRDEDKLAFSEGLNADTLKPTTEPMKPDTSTTEKETVDLTERERLAEERERKLKEREEKLAKQESDRRRQEHADFVETLVKDNARILPAYKATVVEALVQLDSAKDVTVDFGEGDKAEKKPIVEAVKEFLKGIPQQVEFAELSKGRGDRTDAQDPQDQARRISAHVDAEKAKGRTISFSEAQAELKKGL